MEAPCFDAVLVLAGGRSRRLGRSKAWIDWQGTPLLLHVLERLAPLAGRAVVAARPGQPIPPGRYERTDDPRPDLGPLAGIAAGLGRIARDDPDARVAVAACDYPFVAPGLMLALAHHAPLAEAVLPRHGGHVHPLHAPWRARLGEACVRALDAGERRVRAAAASAGVTIVDADLLAHGIDPTTALLNVNDPGALERARRLASRPGHPSP